MEEKKYAYLGLPLKMDLLLKGFASTPFDLKQGTSFKWTENLYEKNNGKLIWIKRKILEWISLINRTSGVKVDSHKFKGTRYTFGFDSHNHWSVLFEFTIPGALDIAKVHPAIAKDFSGFFKKFLAEELLRRFPFPFNIRDLNNPIPFGAGVTDMCRLKPAREYPPDIEKANAILFSPEFRSWLEEILSQKYLAKLLSIKNMGARKNYQFQSIIFLRWQNNASHEVRYSLGNEIVAELARRGAIRPISGREHPYPFFDAHFKN